MFRTIQDFLDLWKKESDATVKIFKAITTECLNQEVCEGHRNIGRVAWHIIQTLPELAGKTGLQVEGPSETAPVPENSDTILTTYQKATNDLASEISQKWQDEDLTKTDNMYGQTWIRGNTLYILIKHEIHHRGQLTVLMRQAGIKVPGIYGPSKEEWPAYNMPEPEI